MQVNDSGLLNFVLLASIYYTNKFHNPIARLFNWNWVHQIGSKWESDNAKKKKQRKGKITIAAVVAKPTGVTRKNLDPHSAVLAAEKPKVDRVAIGIGSSEICPKQINVHSMNYHLKMKKRNKKMKFREKPESQDHP